MTILGRERTVDRSERSTPTGPCEMCGRKRAATWIHEYNDRLILFDHVIKTYDRGENRLCRYCSAEPSLDVIQMPEITDSSHRQWCGGDQPRRVSVSGFRNADFRSVDWKDSKQLIEYVRTKAQSPPHGVDADTVEQIILRKSMLVTEPIHEALRWWIVKALKEATTERERSRYYDLLCCIEKDDQIRCIERTQHANYDHAR
jgi:hypothetical protein